MRLKQWMIWCFIGTIVLFFVSSLHNLIGSLYNNLGMVGLAEIASTTKIQEGLLLSEHELLIPEQQEQIREAQTHFHHALSWLPDAPFIHRNLGRSLAIQRRIEPAIEQLSEATRSGRGEELTYFLLGHAYAEMGLKDSAIASWTRAKDSEMAFILRGKSYLEVGNLQDAQRCYRMAAIIAPAWSEVDFQQGIVAQNRRDWDLALRFFETAKIKASKVSVQSRDGFYSPAMANVHLGQIYLAQEDYTRAVDALKQALAQDPQNYAAFINLGWAVYGQTGKPDLAEPYLLRAAEIKPKNPLPYVRLGEIYNTAGNIEVARYWLERAARLDPDSPQVLVGLGQLEFELGNYDEAIQLFQKATSFDDQFALGYFWLGRYYLKEGNFQKAQEALLQATSLQPYNPQFSFYLAESYFENGQFEQATSTYLFVLELSPDHAPSLRRLAELAEGD